MSSSSDHYLDKFIDKSSDEINCDEQKFCLVGIAILLLLKIDTQHC